MENKLWFRAKRYGWGWYPVTWQGWAVILIWVAFFTFGVIRLDHEWLKNVVVIFIMTALLIWICYKKGEKPGWHWGEK
ncbi:MAG: hypothetical protein WCF94_00935 [bacterium]